MYQIHTVQFPKLGWKFTINPTAFTVGDFTIQWYGVIIAAGFLLAFLYVMSSCKKFHMDQDKLIDAVIVGIIGGIVGARLYYVMFYPGDQYIRDPISILYIWNGGLAIYGGIIGGLLCGALMARLRRLKVSAVLDLASLGFLIGQSVGRWGNFVNQEAFGTQTDLPWGMLSERTQEMVASGPVHPCFLYESLWCALGFVLLHIFSRKFRRYDGQVFLLYLVWYGLGRFFIEGLRTDSLITPVLDLRVSQLLAAVTVLASIALLIVFRKNTSLSGCGSAAVMERNGIRSEDEPIETPEDGSSTIFGDKEEKAGEEAAEENKEKDTEGGSAVSTPDREKPEQDGASEKPQKEERQESAPEENKDQGGEES